MGQTDGQRNCSVGLHVQAANFTNSLVADLAMANNAVNRNGGSQRFDIETRFPPSGYGGRSHQDAWVV